jgi:hypothetical protein
MSESQDRPWERIPQKHADFGLIALGQRLTWTDPVIDVLKPEFSGRYPLLTVTIDSHFVKKQGRKKLLLPNLRDAETIAIYSDYSGESSGHYMTYSFLVCSWNYCELFYKEMRELRTGELGPKEISFKEFGMDRYREICPDTFGR